MAGATPLLRCKIPDGKKRRAAFERKKAANSEPFEVTRLLPSFSAIRSDSPLRSISVQGVGDKDANAKNYKKCCNNFKKHLAALKLQIWGLTQWSSKKPASASQSKRFETDASILSLLMIPSNDSANRRR